MFPAVTLCNQNRVNCALVTEELEGEVRESDSHSANILQWIRTNVCTVAVPGQANLQPNQVLVRGKRQAVAGGPAGSGETPEPLGPPGDTPVYLEAEYIFLAEYMSLNRSIRSLIGHEFQSFIKSCTFRGKDCLNNRSEILLYFQTEYEWLPWYKGVRQLF